MNLVSRVCCQVRIATREWNVVVVMCPYLEHIIILWTTTSYENIIFCAGSSSTPGYTVLGVIKHNKRGACCVSSRCVEGLRSAEQSLGCGSLHVGISGVGVLLSLWILCDEAVLGQYLVSSMFQSMMCAFRPSLFTCSPSFRVFWLASISHFFSSFSSSSYHVMFVSRVRPFRPATNQPIGQPINQSTCSLISFAGWEG